MRRPTARFLVALFLLFLACDGQDTDGREVARVAMRSQALANDADGDGIVDGSDNCPKMSNPTQANTNGVGPGDACEVSLVLSSGLLNQYARFQSHKELLLTYAPLTFSIGPDLMKVNAKAPNGAYANYFLLSQKLGVTSLSELFTGSLDTISGTEILNLGLGTDGVLGGGKATDVYLRLNGNATVSVAFFEGTTARGTQTYSNSSTGVRRFTPSGSVLFDRIELRATSGKVSIVGPNDAVMFALGQAQLPCPSGYERVGGSCIDINECTGLNHVCDALTTCTNTQGSYTCGPCPTGYTGTGATSCVDIDECTSGSAPCSTLVTCSNSAGSYQCGVCPAGYRGDGHACTDIDECVENLDDCDALVTCTNRAGGYDCGACPSGYSGGGSSGCVDINECTGPDHVCDSLVTCTNSPGGYTCGACPSGYRGDGRTCTDIDECAEGTAQCSPLVQCGNTAGSYQCGACPTGFAGDGYTCADVDECLDGSAQCAPGVACTNVVGSYRCGACPNGYTGDGYSCADIDECASTPCDPRVACTNSLGGFSCGACPVGFRGDGYAGCIDIDECAEDLDTCSPLVTCGNTLGGYVCSDCPAGYGGDGHLCSDIDECATHSAQCSELVSCTNNVGGYTCGTCPGGYRGDGHSCVDIDECATAPCDSLTACSNTPGSYTCAACPAGYQGDGYAGCVDIDECAVSNGGCPETERCVNAPGTRTCVPCAPGSTGTTTTCGVGACAAQGMTLCVLGQVTDSCSPAVPAPADPSCDNVDDDCDGVVDEDVASAATSCGTGACARAGVLRCVAGAMQNTCVPGVAGPNDQSCDGIDSDCDGSQDEDYVSQSISCGVGACARSTTTRCVEGVVDQACQAGTAASSDASCNAIDEDCDGLIDEDFVQTPTSCGIGACTRTGTLICSAGVVVDACVPGIAAAHDDCGNGDEDCDGYVDEDCCVPATCAAIGANCGAESDGCGGTLNCGACAAPETCGGGGTTNVCGVPNLPPASSAVAPPITGRLPTPAEALSFLYSGDNPIQQGVTAGAIVPDRVAAVRGRVLKVDDSPLAGARVSLVGHPEFGFTLSRNDGSYDFAFNAGAVVTLEFTRPGYLPSQRNVDEPWNGQGVVPDVALKQLSTVATQVRTGLSQVQPIVAEAITDESGTRQPFILFPPDANPVAEVDGQSIPLPQLTIRATEYTVGATGPKAMPASLPATSAYTYAVEMSVDEVGPTTTVRFAKPLPFYLENFIGFATGAAIPAGYYDREKSVWVPQPDGLVVRIHSVTDGMANLVLKPDVDVPATAAELAEVGIADWERSHLASRYSVGATLWRLALDHFSPCDFNLAFVGPRPEDAPQPTPVIQRPQCPTLATGSIIDCQGRVLAEEIEAGDTGLTLRYQSDRVKGGGAHARDVEIVIPSAPPEGTRRRFLEVFVGRRQALHMLIPDGMTRYVYQWDGRDAEGRIWPGPIAVTYWISHDINIPYLVTTWQSRSSSFGQLACSGGCSCSSGSGGTILGSETIFVRNPNGAFTSSRKRVILGEHSVESYGLMGWNFVNHHQYSPVTKTVYFGDGRVRKIDDVISEAQILAGYGSDGLDQPMVASSDAYNADLGVPAHVAGGPNGSAYFKVHFGGIWEVTQDGRLRPVVVDAAYTTALANALVYAVDAQGGLYVGANDTVFRLVIDETGRATVTRVTGRGITGVTHPSWTEGALVSATTLGTILDVAPGPDGRLYILARPLAGGEPRVILVQPDGRGRHFYTANGVANRVLEVGPSGNVYVADYGPLGTGGRIVRITPQGVVDVYAGGGTVTSEDPSLRARDAQAQVSPFFFPTRKLPRERSSSIS